VGAFLFVLPKGQNPLTIAHPLPPPRPQDWPPPQPQNPQGPPPGFSLEDQPTALPPGYVIDLPAGGLTHEDLRVLRGEGERDDAILNRYRDFAPQHRSDIDELLKAGERPEAILDGLARFYAQGAPTGSPGQFKAPQTPADPMANKGTTQRFLEALQYGAANRLAGYGSTAKALGATDAGGAVMKAAQGFAPSSYHPASADFFDPRPGDKGIGGYGWSYAPRMIAEAAPGLAVDLAAGALTGGLGFLASNASANLGPNLDARMANQKEGSQPTTGDYAAAGLSTLAETALSRVGLNNALTSVTRGAGMGAVKAIPGAVVKAGAVDAAAGTAGNVIEQVGRTAGTDAGLSVSAHEAIGSGVLSGGLGGSIRGIRGVGDIVNAIRYSDMDPARATRLADHFTRLEADNPTNAADAFQAIQRVEGRLRASLGVAEENAKSYLRHIKKTAPEGDDTLITLATTTSLLNDGAKVSESKLASLRERLGAYSEGVRLVEALEDLQSLNTLKRQGRMADGYFAGGMSASRLGENIINPSSYARNVSNATIGGVATLGAFMEAPAALAIGLNPLSLGKAFAAQGALYGGLRVADEITGSRNPVAEFVKRHQAKKQLPILYLLGIADKLAREQREAALSRVGYRPKGD